MKSRWQLILVFGIAIATPVASTLFYIYFPPQETTNLGELVEPVSLDSNLIDKNLGKWQVTIVGKADCDLSCRQRLCIATQTRLISIGEIDRIERLWLVDGDGDLPSKLEMEPACGRNLAAAKLNLPAIDVLKGVATSTATASQLALLPTPASGKNTSDYIYLIDPNGDLMMRYGQETPVKNISKDLKRLLRLSQRISTN